MSLPKLIDITNQLPAEAFKKDEFNMLVNQEPPKKWVKQHPFAKSVKYLPIDKVEFMLTRIFQEWRVEVIEHKAIFNAVSCHIRLHYLHPVTTEWSYHDGVGAVDIQTKKDCSPADMENINANAVMKALPAAKSYAIKDAAENLGILFGRDLNRKDTIAFEGAYSKPINKESERVRMMIENASTIEGLDSLLDAATETDQLDIFETKQIQLNAKS